MLNEKHILKLLRSKDAWKCTCKSKQHSYANEKCQLFSARSGEERWKGKNKGVTKEDLVYLLDSIELVAHECEVVDDVLA